MMISGRAEGRERRRAVGMSTESQNVPPSDVPAAPREALGPEFFNMKVPPLIARGNLQFKRDLPRLLEQYRGQWAVYSGEECLGIAKDVRKLEKVVDRRGLKIDEYVFREILPWDPDEVDPGEYINE
jgi:hypothetical protein